MGLGDQLFMAEEEMALLRSRKGGGAESRLLCLTRPLRRAQSISQLEHGKNTGSTCYLRVWELAK
jgi:hypothetical protein